VTPRRAISGPWPGLFEPLRAAHPALAVTLSDLYPNARTLEAANVAGLEYAKEPVSALDVPAPYRGATRTLFTALHHFDRDDVREMLASAQRDGVGFAAFEATQRSVRGGLLTVFIPLLVLFLMPRVRPRRFLPLLLTYLPPVLPFVIWWDGLASTVRTYTAEELRSIVAEIREPGYTWVVEEVGGGSGPIPILSVVGCPSPQRNA
jgi:hypothetical protein